MIIDDKAIYNFVRERNELFNFIIQECIMVGYEIQHWSTRNDFVLENDLVSKKEWGAKSI